MPPDDLPWQEAVLPEPPPTAVQPIAAQPIAPPAPTPAPPPSPLDALRADLQPIAAELLVDPAYWEMLKRTASPRTFLEFVRFAFDADNAKGGGNNTQVVIQAPFPRGPLDVLPQGMRIE